MKVKAEIIIDADRDAVWRQLDNADAMPKWRPTTITERRKPDFLAGIYESNASKAIVVNHFEKMDAKQTRWVVYANHQFKGLMKIKSIFSHNTILKQTEQDMQRFKLLVESRVAEEAQ